MEIIPGDLLEPSSVAHAIGNADFVIHIAGVTRARRPKEFFEGNVVATRNLLTAASRSAKLKKICYVSSLTAVGPSPDGAPLDEQSPCKPITSYGKSKRQAEEVCQSYSSRVPIVILRPPAVYGPRDKDVLELFKAARFGIQPDVGSEQKTLSLLYGPDLAKAIVASTISVRTTGKTYFVADPTVYMQSRIFDLITELVGSRSFRPKIPPSLVYTAAAITEFISFFRKKPAVLSIDKARDLMQRHWVCTAESLRHDIGFEAETGLEDGLRLTYQWYLQQNWV